MKVLITSGATREAIDSVRYITNMSTGETGATIADFFMSQGADVTFVSAGGSVQPRSSRKSFFFEDFKSLNGILKEALQSESFDAVIHAAAVSDYSVVRIETSARILEAPLNEKLDSNEEELTVRLKRNFKILGRLKSYSKNSNLTVVAFKLTNHASPGGKFSAVERLVDECQAHFVVHNDLKLIKGNEYVFEIFNRQKTSIRECHSRMELAQSLYIVLGRANDFDT